MSSITVRLLNPKAKRLLQDLAELNLIAISDETDNPFFQVVDKLRSANSEVKLEEIQSEVKQVRKERYGEKT